MIPRQVAIVSSSANITGRQLCIVSAAIERQATRDFAPIWQIEPTVDPFLDLADVPAGYWPIVVLDDIHQRGAAGVHLDKQGLPYSLVQYSSTWSLTCSHECLEMLADPWGSRVVPGPAPALAGVRRVEYLLEVCDPCEDARFGYTVNDILVSDFYTPHFFDPAPGSTRYDFTGAIGAPRQVLDDGYISWHDPADGHWPQLTNFGKEEIRDLGALDRREGSPREQIDRKTDVSHLIEGAPLSDEQRDRRAQSKAATNARAVRLLGEVDERWPS